MSILTHDPMWCSITHRWVGEIRVRNINTFNASKASDEGSESLCYELRRVQFAYSYTYDNVLASCLCERACFHIKIITFLRFGVFLYL